MKPTCVLLSTDDIYLSTLAHRFAKKIFNVIHFEMHKRSDTVLFDDSVRGDILLNFLSPVILDKSYLDHFVTAINFHPAPPEYPGVGGPSYAIYNGDIEYGVTAHRMIEEVDAGTILDELRFPITEGETCESLHERALLHSLIQFYKVLSLMPYHQNFEYAKWKRKAITRKEFDDFMTVKSFNQIERKIRALKHSRFPGPFVELYGRRWAYHSEIKSPDIKFTNPLQKTSDAVI